MYNIMSKHSFIVCLPSRLVLSTKLYLSVSLQTLTPLNHVFWPTSPCTWSNANQSSYQVWCIFNTILRTTYDLKYSRKTDTNFGMDIEVGRWEKSLQLVGCHLLCSTNTDKRIGRIQI